MYQFYICMDLVYVLVLNHKGYIVEFKSEIVIKSKGNVLVKDMKNHDINILDVDTNKVSIFNYLNVSIDFTYVWCLRFGYINKNKMIKM